MQSLGFLAIGFLAGIGFMKLQPAMIAKTGSSPQTQSSTVTPKDRVTIPRSELKQLLRGILIVDDESQASDFRYVSQSGSLAFECPTKEACNLEVPARAEATSTKTITRVIIQGSGETVDPQTNPQAYPAEGMEPDQVTHSAARTESSDPTAIYDRFGVQEGDVFVSINSEPVGSPGDAFAMLTRLRPSEVVDLVVRRNGREIKLAPRR